jgi:hypothetical protein
VAGSYEYYNDLAHSIKSGEFLDELIDEFQLLKNPNDDAVSRGIACEVYLEGARFESRSEY